jgi:NADH dehydrogenase/NADH:ubiquinone oxidoreductase subunit G
MIDLCPVGALTSKPFRYSARSWELSRRKSISLEASDADAVFGQHRLTTETSGRSAALERGKPILQLFDTLQSQRRDGRFAVQQDVKAHERRFRGSTRPSLEG